MAAPIRIRVSEAMITTKSNSTPRPIPFTVTWDGTNIVFTLRDTKEIVANYKEITN